jgi:Zn-dependent peptidase ImmA (M78 family)
MAPRYSLAKRTARDLLRKAGETKPGFRVDRVAAFAGAEVKYEPFEGELSGMVYRRLEGKSVIGVNLRHPPNRRRFTIAHEIGHLMLHADEIHIDEGFPFAFRDEISSLAKDPAEIEANQFAAELLMPEAWLVNEIRDHLLDIESEGVIKSLANKYGVSVVSMTHRLTSLTARR